MIPQRVAESSTLALLQKVRELKASGKDVVSFAAGEADFNTPEVVVAETFESIRRGNTRYVSTQGVPVLREIVAQDYRKRLGATWVKDEHVLACAGAKQAIYLAMVGLLEPGAKEEVIIPKPYWVSYPGITKTAAGVDVYVDTKAEDGFFPTVSALDKVKSAKSKILILSSPANPTGTMITKTHLQSIVDWCVSNKITLIYDEIYERLVLKDQPHVCALSLVDEAKSEYVIAVNATSKSLAMTGWRLGYLITHPQNIKALNALQSQMLTCLPGFIQEGAAAGLREVDTLFPPIVARFKKRLELLESLLGKIPGITFTPPQGAFYMFANVEGAMKKRGITSDKDFCAALLEEVQVVVNAGSSFGMPGYIRMSFATSEDEIRKGADRIAKFCGV
ncbi:MAG TPA: pyridoxal phosphate-dependent aminotransferase, partial [Bdellovibrionota bacterium]|nr:pyridoxal phosphate-dependent aminotransferase [Bdellovibrionota bacterium]